MAPPRPRYPRNNAASRFANPADRITHYEEESVVALTARRALRPHTNQDYKEVPPEGLSEHNKDAALRVRIPPYADRLSQLERHQRQVRSSLAAESSDAEEYQAEDEEDDIYTSPESQFSSQKRKRSRTARNSSLDNFVIPDDYDEQEQPKRRKVAARQSERATRHQGRMEEKAIDDIYRSADDDAENNAPRLRAVGAREVFQMNTYRSEFASRHNTTCDSCGQDEYRNTLVYCQGCSLAYHHACLGPRSNRAHVVTKIGQDNFVLQCRRCVGELQRKNGTAPHGGKCQDCLEHGSSSLPFRARKTALQEQKERDQNGGVDPITSIDPQLIDNADNVLIRCVSCFRAWHAHHLPAYGSGVSANRDPRLQQYHNDWACNDCINRPGKVTTIIAWRPLDASTYHEDLALELVEEDEKEYLIKFEGESYFRTVWVSGAWLWSRTTPSQRKAFTKRQDVQQPIMTTAAAVPKEYLCADVILDVKYKTSNKDIAQIEQAFIKFRGLPYEEAFWEEPPQQDNVEQWKDFVRAYEDWSVGQQLRAPNSAQLKHAVSSLRHLPFQQLRAQSEILTGGTLMDHQLAGVNWLYYKWFSSMNAILGDEMGLGKTIEVIAFLSALIERIECFPFLIVVPNSTCQNWRREIKHWAPSLKVATYYSSRESRERVAQYELFPNGTRELNCHIVVTSYETAADVGTRQVFRGVHWQGLIVDEGQRLKNDGSNLYAALKALNIPFRLLLTGTPLQNNQRELYNLLQFLDDKLDAAKLEEQYQVLNGQKVTELHAMIRPHFLRRTKQQVLNLPPMQQIILPVSMSLVQKKVYKTILTKNADLLKALLSGHGNKKADKGSLSNILMQLRKCLCHPFVYSQDIEERTTDQVASHRNLVDASNKLKLLEIMLPLLQAAGHRVLFFSQFLNSLDILEDFLCGMGMLYQRLDGNVSSLEKQKRIDKFNAPESVYFAFLLSTRAGGVGINLTSADTVIILDPDFNPHQDIQALSRAHRIGQNKPVLCFRVVTMNSAEERIMSIGKRKLALDKALIQHLDVEDTNHDDLMTALQHGVKELFTEGEDQAIVYDEAKVRMLLDRTRMKSSSDNHEEGNEWSYAEVWKDDKAKAQASNDKEQLSFDAWDKILKDRERLAAKEAAQKNKVLGRGKRHRVTIDYTGRKLFEGVEGLDNTFDVDKLPGADREDNDFNEHSDEDTEDEKAGKTLPTGRKSDAAGKNGKTKDIPLRTAKGIRVPQSKVLLEFKNNIDSKSRKSSTAKTERASTKNNAASMKASASKMKKLVTTLKD